MSQNPYRAFVFPQKKRDEVEFYMTYLIKKMLFFKQRLHRNYLFIKSGNNNISFKHRRKVFANIIIQKIHNNKTIV